MHLKDLHNNMIYIVEHGGKSAVFKLKTKNDTIGEIKKNIAEYFGLPKEKIFLKNKKNEILLTANNVVNELFPLISSNIVNEKPKLYVVFYKNMSSQDYI